MSKTTTEKLYSVREAAEALGKKTAAIMKGIRKGTIKADKVGWSWVITATEIDRLKKNK
jgi:excisionase family DNA binding protein